MRARRRDSLLAYGLAPVEIDRFENSLLLSPTRQRLIEEVAKALDGVESRAELFRHAMTVISEEEIEVFIQSVGMLARIHVHRPAVRIIPGLRLAAAEFGDRRILVFGAFDAVYWTADVESAEQTLRAALPPNPAGLELWLLGSISPRARSELTTRGWEVHAEAATTSVLGKPD